MFKKYYNTYYRKYQELFEHKPQKQCANSKNFTKIIIAIIAPVIENYKSGKITYAETEFNARNKIYQSVDPSFNPDMEYMKDSLSRDIPSVDNSLFIITEKLLLKS